MSVAATGNDKENAQLPAILPKSVEVTLNPLIIDLDSLKKEHQRRKSRSVTQKIHVADCEEMEAKGWEIVKKQKRVAVAQKPKRISQYLEDRVWSLFKDMGYPIMNGASFKVSFDRSDGSKGAKQIDVFAKDDETVAVIECKSREFRGRKSLQKDIHETAFLQKFIANAIRDHFGEGFKPKILWMYVTQNILWSDPDVDRASAENIRVITKTSYSILKHTWLTWALREGINF